MFIKNWASIFSRKKSFDLDHGEGTEILYRNQIIASMGSAATHITIGILFGFSAVTLPGMMNPPIEDPLALSEEQATIFASGINIGAFCGSLASSPFLFYFGQRKAMLFCLPLQAISYILMSQATVFWLVALCRILQGFLNGIIEGASTTYVTEICYPTIRGRMIGSLDLLRQVGIIGIYALGSSHLTWRNVSLICGICGPIIPFTMLFFMPNSPRWLASRHRYDEAESSLLFFRGAKYNVKGEFQSIVEQLSDPTKKLSILDQVKLLKNKSLALVFSVLLCCCFLINFSGLMAIQSYMVLIFSTATKDVNAYTSTIFAGCARFLGCAIFLFWSDRCGRRVLFLLSHVASLISVASLGVFFYYQEALTAYTYMKWMPVACVLLFMTFFSITTASFAGMKTELLPTDFRSFGIGIAFGLFFAGSFTVSMTFFTFKNALGMAGTFWLYAVVGSSVSFLVLMFVPETRGKTLENINVMKTKKANP